MSPKTHLNSIYPWITVLRIMMFDVNIVTKAHILDVLGARHLCVLITFSIHLMKVNPIIAKNIKRKRIRKNEQ